MGMDFKLHVGLCTVRMNILSSFHFDICAHPGRTIRTWENAERPSSQPNQEALVFIGALDLRTSSGL